MLPNDFVQPNYSDGSIANVPATLAKWFDIPFDGLSPLHERLMISAEPKHIVVVLIDALGWNILQQIGDTLPAYQDAAIRAPITSVFPSTTVSALSSVHTGTPPAQHGLMGLLQFFPEYATAAQMIRIASPYMRTTETLIDSGLDPVNFLATESVGSKFKRHGVNMHIFKHHSISNSGLSQILDGEDAEGHGVVSVADMFVQVRQLLEAKRNEHLYVHCYWDTVDVLSHIYGPMSPIIFAEVQTLFHQIKTLLLEKLPKNTIVAMMSDHGQGFREKSKIIQLRDHPRLLDMLFMQQMGTAIVPYFYAKHGQIDAIVDYINGELGDRMIALRSETVLESGLFGAPPYAPKTRERIGDVIALSKAGTQFAPLGYEERLAEQRGAHAGLTSAEMEASWLVWHL